MAENAVDNIAETKADEEWNRTRKSIYRSDTKEETSSIYDPTNKTVKRLMEERRKAKKRLCLVKALHDRKVSKDFAEDKIEGRGKKRMEMGHVSEAVKKQFLNIAFETANKIKNGK